MLGANPIVATTTLLLLACSSVICASFNDTTFAERNSTATKAWNSKQFIPVVHQLLKASPRYGTIGNGVIPDIKNILNVLTGNNVGATGTVGFIIIAVATAVFWIIIFLIIYYAIFAKKEKEGYEEGYASPMPTQGYGRQLSERVLNIATDAAWNAIEKLLATYEF